MGQRPKLLAVAVNVTAGRPDEFAVEYLRDLYYIRVFDIAITPTLIQSRFTNYDRMAGVDLRNSDGRRRRDGIRQKRQYGLTNRGRHFGDSACGRGGGDDERRLQRRLVGFIDRRSAPVGQVRERGALKG